VVSSDKLGRYEISSHAGREVQVLWGGKEGVSCGQLCGRGAGELYEKRPWEWTVRVIKRGRLRGKVFVEGWVGERAGPVRLQLRSPWSFKGKT